MKDWPAWLRYTLTALAGAGLTLVTTVLAFAEVRVKAEAADKRSSAHEPRITALELRVARDDERWSNLFQTLGRWEKKLDEALAAKPR